MLADQALLQRLIQQVPGLVQPALGDGGRAHQHLGPGGQPGVAEALRQVVHLAQVAQRVVVAAHGHLHGAEVGAGLRRPEGLVLAAELRQARRRLPPGAVEVAGDRRGPRHGQQAHRAQERVLDRVEQRFQVPAGRQRRRIVAHLVGGHRRGPHQLGARLRAQRAGGRQELIDPAAGLGQVLPQEPERPQDPEQMRQRRGIVAQVPAHRGGEVARFGLQAIEQRVVAGPAQRPVGPLGQRPVVAGVAAADLAGVGPARQPLGDEGADGLQHPRPRAGPAVVQVDQAVLGEGLRQLQRPVLVQAGHLRRGLDGPAVHEHRHGLQQGALGVVEQAHAPLDRGPQGLLALGQVHRARPQRVERGGEPAQQRGGIEQPGAGGGQLDGQRQALQPPADLRHRRGVARGEGEAGAHRAGPVDKQRHRR